MNEHKDINYEEAESLDKIYKEKAELLLKEYGPEGVYILAKKLIECTNEDISP